MSVHVYVCMRACVYGKCVCVRACVHCVCVHACMCVCVCACAPTTTTTTTTTMLQKEEMARHRLKKLSPVL